MHRGVDLVRITFSSPQTPAADLMVLFSLREVGKSAHHGKEMSAGYLLYPLDKVTLGPRARELCVLQIGD